MKLKRLGFLWALAFSIVFAPQFARAQQSQPAAASAEPMLAQSAGSPQHVTLGSLPQMTAAEMAAAAQQVSPAPRTAFSEQQYQSAKAAVAAKVNTAGKTAESANAPAEPSAGILTPLTSVSFGGLGSGCGNLFPPDMALAVNQQFVLQVINGCVAVFDKTGVMQPGFPKKVNAFLGLAATAFTFDPRALYDWVNNRFVVMVDRCFSCGTASNVSSIDIAVSQTSNPLGGWNIYHLPLVGLGVIPMGDFADFPTLGQDRRAFYVGFNDFPSGGGFNDFVMFLPKAKMYAGASIGSFWSFQNFNLSGTRVDTIQPANGMNIGDNPRAEFMVNSLNFAFGGGSCSGVSGCNGLVVWAVSNPLFVSGSVPPEVTGQFISTVSNYFLPPNAQQNGCTSGPCLIDTNDVRISGEVTYSAGSLYGALTTNGTSGGAGFSHYLWFAVRPFLNGSNPRCTGSFLNRCPDIVGIKEINEVCWACGSSGEWYFPTVQPDPEGNVTVVFNFSNSGTFPESAYASSRVTQSFGTQPDPGIILQGGLATYNFLFSGRNRWGDYTATAPDLTSAISPAFWFAGESSKTGTSYRTAIGRNAYTIVAQP
jgi:hypothetical protein